MTRRLSCLVAALALAGAVAGCGGGDDGTSDAVASLDEEVAAQDDGDDEGSGNGSSVDSAEFEDAMLEYAACMRDHGIDMPDPEFDGNGGVRISARPGTEGGPSDDEFEEADEACQPILEDARPDVEIDPEQQAEMQDQLVALAECMRERGHDMPDPEISADGGVRMRVGGPGGPGGERPDEEFEQDIEECQDESGLEAPSGSGAVTSNGSGGE